jgi:predicted TIM-barrel fold metal-dependent hydrolase
MIIDSHQHVFWHGRDDAGLIADMDESGIRVAWLLTWEMAPEEHDSIYHDRLNPINLRADGTHKAIPLADIIATRNKYPTRFIAGYCPHPLKGNAALLFESAYKIHGVRVCGEWKFRMLIDDPRCLELFRKAGELRCPVVLHLDVPFRMEDGRMTYQKDFHGGTVDNLERALEACPETNFVGHAPGFWREISGDAENDPELYPSGPIVPGGKLFDLFDRHPNLYADLSAGSALFALKRDVEHATNFLIRYQDRLLFGRDIYGTHLNDFLKTLDLPEEAKAKIYYQNAMKLVEGLPPAQAEIEAALSTVGVTS